MNKKIRYAVVGLGHLAQTAVLPALRHAENSELAALVTGHPEKDRELSERYGVKAYTYDDLEDALDLNVSLLKIAREHGTRISLGTDAHHPWQLQFIDLGLAEAMRAKIRPERMVNFMTLRALRNWVAVVREREPAKLGPKVRFRHG